MTMVDVDMLILYGLMFLFAGCISAASLYSQRFLGRLKEVDSAYYGKVGGTAKFHQVREQARVSYFLMHFAYRIPKDLPADDKLRSLAYANQYTMRGLIGVWVLIFIVSFV